MRFPQIHGGDLINLRPHLRVAVTFAPIRLQVLIVENRQITIDPSGQVNTVGDRCDWHFPIWKIGPQVLPHLLRDFAMQNTHCVAGGRGAQGTHRHGKRFLFIAAIMTAQGDQILETDPGLAAILVEVFAHQAAVE